jgi:hypothetical protein
MERQGEHGGGDHGKCGVLRTAPREISDALRYGEVACDTPNANRVQRVQRGGTWEARQVRRYLGA